MSDEIPEELRLRILLGKVVAERDELRKDNDRLTMLLKHAEEAITAERQRAERAEGKSDAPSHVCGLQGFDPMRGDDCPVRRWHMKAYIIYDGRAMLDTDDAAVLEAVIPKNDLRVALNMWKRDDAVLVEYDANNAELTNERVIGHVNEGIDTLLARCTSGGESDAR